MQNKSTVIIVGILVIVVAALALIVFKKPNAQIDTVQDQSSVSAKETTKEYRNDQAGISFNYPVSYTVSNSEVPGKIPGSLELEISNGSVTYYVTSSDMYGSINNSPQISQSLKYKSVLFQSMTNKGILFWRSAGTGPDECYEDTDCTSYSDEFQFGVRFDMAPTSGNVITFNNNEHFRDGKNAHTIEDVKNLPKYKDFFDIVNTVKIY